MAEIYDDWTFKPDFDDKKVPVMVNEWASYSRDKKIGSFLALVKNNRYITETDQDLNELRGNLEREGEHHLRYLSEISGLFNYHSIDNYETKSKQDLFGSAFIFDDKENSNVVSIPPELKFGSKIMVTALSSRLSSAFSAKVTSKHFVENDGSDSDSDTPTSGNKTPRSRSSPGPGPGLPRKNSFPNKNIPKHLTNYKANTLNNSRDSNRAAMAIPDNRPFKAAMPYVKPPPKTQLISSAESQKILSEATANAALIRQLDKERREKEKIEERLREKNILKLSKQGDKADRLNFRHSDFSLKLSKMIRNKQDRPDRRADSGETRRTPRSPPDSSLHSPTFPIPKPVKKIYRYYNFDDIALDPASENGELIVSSEPEQDKPDSSDEEFDKIINNDNLEEISKLKKPKTSESNEEIKYKVSGYPENGEAKARTVLQILGSSLIVNPLDLSLIMNCLKGTYKKPSHISSDYYMIVIAEEEVIVANKVEFSITGFEIYFDETNGHRWDLFTYTPPTD